MGIVARIDALLANTPPSEVEQFEVCRCLRDAKGEIERLRLTDAEREAIEFVLGRLSGTLMGNEECDHYYLVASLLVK